MTEPLAKKLLLVGWDAADWQLMHPPTASGGPTQTALSPTTAAGRLPINTVGTPGPTSGPPTCGTGGTGGRPGVTIGQACRSLRRAAGGMVGPSRDLS